MLPSTAEIAAKLDTVCIGTKIEVHQEIGSTNDRARELARQGAPDGTVVIAEYQSSGRGRLQRRWYAPPGTSLLMSLLLKPDLAPHQAQRATMLCSLAAVEAIEQEAGLSASVKWPNDLHLRGRKLGGVLTELGEIEAGHLTYVVVGMGINVNLDPEQLPETMTPPISLAAALGHPVSRNALLVAFLNKLDAHYQAMRAGWSPHQRWRQYLNTLGQEVHVSTPAGVIKGVAEDVDADGALLVRQPNGVVKHVLAGDVTLRKGDPPDEM